MDILYHGSMEVVQRPEVRLGRYNKDFYHGFYCTRIYRQAYRWATRFHNTGIINEYSYMPDDALQVKVFPNMSEEWLDFIVACRMGKAHGYDIVEGPMANDTIFNYVQDLTDGRISREAFWALAKFKHPTHQISFHTEHALRTLSFLKAHKAKDEE